MNQPSLFYREQGTGDPIIILHGIFGSSDNWMTVARSLSSDYKVFTLDQRNHGQSFHSDKFDYPSMVNDLKKFIAEHEIVNPFIIGHSMGGKVAMNFAISFPELLKELVIVDISPRSYPIHHDNILEGLSSIELDKLQSRNDADTQLSKYVSDSTTRNFLLKNLSRDETGNFTWKINLPVIRMKMEWVGIGLPGNDKFEKKTLFIKGEKSNYINEQDYDLIKARFPNSEIKVIKDAGHWVHAEQPELFITLLNDFLKS
jgi:pimeloyl-ACP methyl ester carboxylesterase